MSGLAGKRVLITAGASGIGRAMATAFAAEGAQVWVTDVDARALAECPPDWQKAEVSVADQAGMAALFGAVSAAWGGLDVLCANAGIAGPTARIEDQDAEGVRACLAVGLEGSLFSVQGALPLMRAAGGGSVIFTTSTAGLFGYPYRAPYAMAKWGVIGLMKTVAMEAGPDGIRANAIAPGAVDGPRMDGVLAREAAAKGTTPQAVRAAYEAGTSMRSFVTAEDIAAMAVFLGSDAARRISGQVIAVDGHTENPDPKVAGGQVPQ